MGNKKNIDNVDKLIYDSILSEFRHRHGTIWKTRQILITMIIASMLFAPKFKDIDSSKCIAIATLLFGTIFSVLFVDFRYQKKKKKLLCKLYNIEKKLVSKIFISLVPKMKRLPIFI